MKYTSACFLWIAMAACAASAQPYKVYKLYAYSRVYLPGMITADEAREENVGKQTYNYTVYVETGTKQLPQITGAWVDGKSYEATPFAIPENKAAAGVAQKSGKPIVIQPARGRYLYKVEFQPAEVAKKLPPTYQNKTAGKILLQLRLNGKDTWQLTGPVETLEPVEMC